MTDLSATLANASNPFNDVARPAEGDDRYWSVTTIIGALDKPALAYWAAEQAAIAACDIAKSLPTRIVEEGRDSVVKYLRDARFRTRKTKTRTAAELGTAVHDACEQFALTGQRPEVDAEVSPFLDGFEAWCDEWQPQYIAAEMSVYSPRYRFAGTLDAILTVRGTRVIVDYKTSKAIYPEVALQLAAYRHAELAAVWRARRFEQFRRRYYLLNADEAASAASVPEVDGGLALHLTPGKCRAYTVQCDETVFAAFLHITEAARWQFDTSKTVIGEELS